MSTRKFTVIEFSTAGYRAPRFFVLSLVRETKTTLVMAYPSASDPKRTVTFNKETNAVKTHHRARRDARVYGWERLQWLCEVYA